MATVLEVFESTTPLAAVDNISVLYSNEIPVDEDFVDPFDVDSSLPAAFKQSLVGLNASQMLEQIQLFKEAEEERENHVAMMSKAAKLGIFPDADKPSSMGTDTMQFAMVDGHMAMHVEFAMNRMRTIDSNLIVIPDEDDEDAPRTRSHKFINPPWPDTLSSGSLGDNLNKAHDQLELNTTQSGDALMVDSQDGDCPEEDVQPLSASTSAEHKLEPSSALDHELPKKLRQPPRSTVEEEVQIPPLPPQHPSPPPAEPAEEIFQPKSPGAPKEEPRKKFVYVPPSTRTKKIFTRPTPAQPWTRPENEVDPNAGNKRRRNRGLSKRQVEQPQWQFSWGIRLGEVQLPQLSIWGFGSSDEEEEDGDEAGKDAQKPTVYKAPNLPPKPLLGDSSRAHSSYSVVSALPNALAAVQGSQDAGVPVEIPLSAPSSPAQRPARSATSSSSGVRLKVAVRPQMHSLSGDLSRPEGGSGSRPPSSNLQLLMTGPLSSLTMSAGVSGGQETHDMPPPTYMSPTAQDAMTYTGMRPSSRTGGLAVPLQGSSYTLPPRVSFINQEGPVAYSPPREVDQPLLHWASSSPLITFRQRARSLDLGRAASGGHLGSAAVTGKVSTPSSCPTGHRSSESIIPPALSVSNLPAPISPVKHQQLVNHQPLIKPTTVVLPQTSVAITAAAPHQSSVQGIKIATDSVSWVTTRPDTRGRGQQHQQQQQPARSGSGMLLVRSSLDASLMSPASTSRKEGHRVADGAMRGCLAPQGARSPSRGYLASSVPTGRRRPSTTVTGTRPVKGLSEAPLLRRAATVAVAAAVPSSPFGDTLFRPTTAFAPISSGLETQASMSSVGGSLWGGEIPVPLTLSPPRQLRGANRVCTPASNQARQQSSMGRAMQDIETAWRVVRPSVDHLAMPAERAQSLAGGQLHLQGVGASAWGAHMQGPTSPGGPNPLRALGRDHLGLMRTATAPAAVIQEPLSHDELPWDGHNWGDRFASPGGPTHDSYIAAVRSYDTSHLENLTVPPGCPPNVERILREKLGSRIQP